MKEKKDEIHIVFGTALNHDLKGVIHGIIVEINGKNIAITAERSDKWMPFNAFKLKEDHILILRNFLDLYLKEKEMRKPKVKVPAKKMGKVVKAPKAKMKKMGPKSSPMGIKKLKMGM